MHLVGENRRRKRMEWGREGERMRRGADRVGQRLRSKGGGGRWQSGEETGVKRRKGEAGKPLPISRCTPCTSAKAPVGCPYATHKATENGGKRGTERSEGRKKKGKA